MAAQYLSTFPSVFEVPASLKKFFERFYQVSDTPDTHEQCADAFTGDAVLVMASARVEGREGW